MSIMCCEWSGFKVRNFVPNVHPFKCTLTRHIAIKLIPGILVYHCVLGQTVKYVTGLNKAHRSCIKFAPKH